MSKTPRSISRKPDNFGFVIRKSSLIQKNRTKIEDVYDINRTVLGSGAFGVVC